MLLRNDHAAYCIEAGFGPSEGCEWCIRELLEPLLNERASRYRHPGGVVFLDELRDKDAG
jgi:hypothetical protein